MFYPGDSVWFRDEVTGRKREARVLRADKEGRQTFYVVDGDGLDMMARIALPKQLSIRTTNNDIQD